ncbi:hypothetical protein Q7L71_22480, partial [Conexibacter sp. CPCC 205706]
PRRRRAAVADAPRRRVRIPRLALGGGLATALAVLVAAFLLLTPNDGGRAPGGLGAAPVTAAELGARVGDALARIETLQAVLVVTERPSPDLPLRTTRYRLLRTDAGDERLMQIGGGFDRAYDAFRGVEREAADASNGDQATVTSGLAPGPPDRPLGDLRAQQQLGGVARALRAAGAAPVREVTDGGRPAWRIAVRAEQDVHALAGDTGDRLELTIDQGTGLPLRIRETYRGRLVAERRLQRLRIDAPLPERQFDPSLSGPATELDGGFAQATLQQASARFGYAPLAPGWLPQGFRRAETAIAATTPSPTGAEGLNPPTRDAVSTAYRRGLDTLVVSTRKVDGMKWSDPVALPEGFLVRPQRACFRTGALAGSCGELMVDPRATPHVWAIAGGLVVTVAGDLTQGELERVAGSLAPIG